MPVPQWHRSYSSPNLYTRRILSSANIETTVAYETMEPLGMHYGEQQSYVAVPLAIGDDRLVGSNFHPQLQPDKFWLPQAETAEDCEDFVALPLAGTVTPNVLEGILFQNATKVITP